MAWYNTYRPQSFEDVIGQDLAKKILQNSLQKNHIKNAYLLSGPKGIGKTTLARIFAKALNQTQKNTQAELDIIELDAASNTGIDNIRQLIESAKVPPIAGDYKIYIIDEVHMLSKPAMNALLKILEEPPKYLVFLLATTNPEKLIDTVTSRLTKIQLSSHSLEQLIGRLEFIADKEKLQIEPKSLKLIAKRSRGSQRDAINLLETVASYNLDNYDESTTAKLLGLVSTELLEILINELNNQEITPETLEKINNTGIDGTQLLAQLLDYLLDQAFAGNTEADQLIQAIAKIISQKLSLSTPLSSLTLVLVEMRNTGSNPSTKPVKKNLANDVSFASQQTVYQVKEEPVKKYTSTSSTEPSKDLENYSEPAPEDSKETENKQAEAQKTTDLGNEAEVLDTSTENLAQAKDVSNIETTSKIEEAKSDHQEELKSENTKLDVSLDQLETWLKEVIQEPNSPVSFKMIIPGCSITEVLESQRVIKVGTAHEIFISQLSSASNLQYLNQYFSQKVGVSVKIEVQKTEKPKPPQNLSDNFSYEQTTETDQFIPADSFSPSVTNQDNLTNQEVESTNTPKKDSNQAQSGQIFYKVYKSLPPGVDPDKLEVIENISPAPKSTWGKSEELTENGVDWDEHVEDMFALE